MFPLADYLEFDEALGVWLAVSAVLLFVDFAVFFVELQLLLLKGLELEGQDLFLLEQHHELAGHD
jgi:hypothetical protein